MISLKASLLVIAKATALVVCGIICVSLIWTALHLAMSSNYRSRAWRTAAAWIGATAYGAQEAQSGGDSDPQSAENAETNEMAGHHFNVVNWVIGCTGAKRLTDLPGYVQEAYPVGAGYTIPQASYQMTTLPAGTREPNGYERALMQLSNSIWQQRFSLRSKAQHAYTILQVATLITIALGMLTTVLISFSSTEFGRGDNSAARTIRALAIFFPALGTAAAAAIAFYGPQSDWNQTSRTLASFAQLHNQMAMDVWLIKCAQGPDPTPELKKSVEDWHKRFLDIQTVANAADQTGSAGTAGAANATRSTPGGSTTPPPRNP